MIPDEQLPAPSPNKKYRPKYIPIATLIDLENRGLTHEQIARCVGITRPNVSLRLSKINRPATLAYVASRAEILAWLQRRIIDSITDAEIKKASVAQRVMMYGILYDKERLERGMSTQNIHALTAFITEAHKQGAQKGVPQPVVIGPSDNPDTNTSSEDNVNDIA